MGLSRLNKLVEVVPVDLGNRHNQHVLSPLHTRMEVVTQEYAMLRATFEAFVPFKLSLFTGTDPIVNPTAEWNQWSFEILAESQCPWRILGTVRVANVVRRTSVLKSIGPVNMSKASLF